MKYKVTLNKRIYEVEVEKGEAVMLAEYEAAIPIAAPAPVAVQTAVSAPVVPAPIAAAANAPVNAIKSPLPGNINAIKVNEGQLVKAGEVLIILEAMKMENEIKAPKDGKVGRILVTRGAIVQTGAPLIELL